MDIDTSADSFFEDLIAAVEQQLDSPETRYVRDTYDRLLKSGMDDEEAKERIAECLAEETDAMFRGRRDFDVKSYRSALGNISPGD